MCRSIECVVDMLLFLLSAGRVVMHDAEEGGREGRRTRRVGMVLRFCMLLLLPCLREACNFAQEKPMGLRKGETF